jgi:hypothetical protein
MTDSSPENWERVGCHFEEALNHGHEEHARRAAQHLKRFGPSGWPIFRVFRSGEVFSFCSPCL